MLNSDQSSKQKLQQRHDHFVQSFLDEKSSRYQRLVAPVGMGKTDVAVKIIQKISQTKDIRILFFLPTKALVENISLYIKAEVDIPVEAVDVRKFREMLTKTDIGASPWPINAVVIMPIDVIKSPQVFDYIMQAQWDLIIFNDVRFNSLSISNYVSSNVKVEPISIFQFLLKKENASRILILDSILLPHRQGEDDFMERKFVTTNWHSPMSYDNPLNIQLSLEVIKYQRSPEEIELIQKYLQLQELSKNTTYEDLFRIKDVSSSLYAIEQSLRRIRNTLVHEDALSFIGTSKEGVPAEVAEWLAIFVSRKKEKLLDFDEKLTQVLDTFKNIVADNKFDALMKYVRECPKGKRILIYGNDADTISYLDTSLKELRRDVYQFSARQKINNQETSPDKFLINGGFLLLSSANITSLRGIEIELDEIILYDIPNSSASTRVIISRLFNTAQPDDSQLSSKKVVAFEDKSKILPIESDLLQRLKRILRNFSANSA
jgi:ERCC4-related helicase